MLNKLVVDIADYTESVNPLPLHQASTQMVILKVTKHFEKNGRAFENSGMPIAAYHWADPTMGVAQQVDETLNRIRASGLPILAIFVDFAQWWSKWAEWNKFLQKKLAWELVSRFDNEKLSNHAEQVFEAFAASEWKIFGYTQASFVNDFAPEAKSWIPQYRWWLSHYLDYAEETLSWANFHTRFLSDMNLSPDLPPGLSRDKMIGHQFTSDALYLPGLYGNMNRTKGAAVNISLFDAQFLEEIEAIPNPKPLPDTKYEAVVTAFPSLRVRSGPGTSFGKLYSLKKDKKIEIAIVKDKWAKLRSYTEEWSSARYLNMVAITPPTEDDNDSVVESRDNDSVVDNSNDSIVDNSNESTDTPIATGTKKWCIKSARVYEKPRGNKKDGYIIIKRVYELTGKQEVVREEIWSEIKFKGSTGWVQDIYLEELIEDPTSQGFEVLIPNPTADSTDAAQYLKWEKPKHINMCGELCVAFIGGDDIETFLTKWKEMDRRAYDRIVPNDKTTGADMVDSMLKVYGYTGLNTHFKEGLKDPHSGLKMSPGRFKKKLKTHYLIASVGIGSTAGNIGGGNIRHWVVLDKVFPEGIEKGWVEIYNPFPNKRQEYSFLEFRNSCEARGWIGLWVKRTPPAPNS